jgi:serine protease Do
MKYDFYKSLLFIGIIIPTFLFSACSEEPEHIYVSSSPKVWLGVNAKNISERRLDNLKLDYGIEVAKVYKDSPAENAGLQEEDILLKINGNPLEDVDKMIDLVKDMEIDEKISITYLREGKELETEAIMSKRKRNTFVWNDKNKNLEHFVSDDKSAWLGISTEKLTDQLRQYFNAPEYLGVLIKEVVEESPAEKFGLKAGDVIIKVGNKEIEDSRDLRKAIDRYKPGEEVEVKIIRDKDEKILKVTLGESKGRFRQHFSFSPDRFEVDIPEIDIDLEELEELDERIKDEFEKHSDELEELNRELKRIKIHTNHRESIII